MTPAHPAGAEAMPPCGEKDDGYAFVWICKPIWQRACAALSEEAEFPGELMMPFEACKCGKTRATASIRISPGETADIFPVLSAAVRMENLLEMADHSSLTGMPAASRILH